MPPWVMPLYTTALLGAFLLFGWMVRSNRLEGRAILVVGTAIGLAATIASYLILRMASGGKLPIQAILFNAIAMAGCTGFVVGGAYRQQKVEDLFETTIEGTRVVVRQCSAFRIRDLDALIVPTSTTLASLSGPSTTVLSAAGGPVEKETRALSPVKPDKVVTTGAGRLGVGQLIHVAVLDPVKSADPNRLRRGIENGALQARKSGVRRVGVVLSPLRGISGEEGAKAVAGGLMRHGSAFEEVVLIGLDFRTARALQNAAFPPLPEASA